MTFKFFLPENGTIKNIHLCLIDQSINLKYIFRTSLRIHQDEWDEKKERPKNIYLKKFKILNIKLNKIKLQLSEYFIDKRSVNKIPSQREISKEIKNICINKEKVLPANSLISFTIEYIKSREEIICNSTLKRYKVFLSLLEKFEGFSTQRLYIDTINSKFINEFLKFGRNEKYSDNTLYRTINFVKTILNFAERNGFNTNIRQIEIRKDKQNRTVITLNEEDILSIHEVLVPDKLKSAKDWLIISCYTGQRFSDFINFNTKKLIKINETLCIEFIQKKTKKKITLPLHPKILAILKKNKYCFPKKINLQQYNKDIKNIAELANIKTLIRGNKRIGFRVKDLMIEKFQLLSSHIGRRSFASNFYGKIPTPLLMDATGHTTEQMFLRYINPNNNDRIMTLYSYFQK